MLATRPIGRSEGGMMEVSEDFSETTAPDLATEANVARPPYRTRKPRRPSGRNVVAEVIAARGRRGGKGMALAQIEGGIPRITNFRAPQPPQSEFVISRTILDRAGPEGPDRRPSEDRGEVKAGDDIKTPNTAAGPSGSSEVLTAHTHPELCEPAWRSSSFQRRPRGMGSNVRRRTSTASDSSSAAARPVSVASSRQ